MNNLSDILMSQNFTEKINKQVDLYGSISKFLNSTDWAFENTALKISKVMLRGSQAQPHFANSVYEMSKVLASQPKISIPQTAIMALRSIGDQNHQLFKGLHRQIGISNQIINASQLSSLHLAMNGISSKLIEIATAQKQWHLLDDFEEITAGAITIKNKIVEEEGLSKENFEELKKFFIRIDSKIDKTEKGSQATFWKILTLLSVILAMLSEVRNWSPKPDYATKKDVEITISNNLKSFSQQLKEQKEYRITNRKSTVFLKPKTKTSIITKLPEKFELIILNIYKKWIYVSFLDPRDGLPQTGWIMKKYTTKIK